MTCYSSQSPVTLLEKLPCSYGSPIVDTKKYPLEIYSLYLFKYITVGKSKNQSKQFQLFTIYAKTIFSQVKYVYQNLVYVAIRPILCLLITCLQSYLGKMGYRMKKKKQKKEGKGEDAGRRRGRRGCRDEERGLSKISFWCHLFFNIKTQFAVICQQIPKNVTLFFISEEKFTTAINRLPSTERASL